MEKSVFTIFVICLPGLLSASCSSGGGVGSASGTVGSSSSNSGSTLQDPHLYNYNPEMILNSNNIPPPGTYYPSGLHDFDSSSHPSTSETEARGEECKNGWCGEDGSCICNPCWSGPTCQEYVDRFAPRFLAEEPFFIVDASVSGGGYSTFLDPAFDPIYPQWPISASSSSSSSSSSPSSDFVDTANLWTTTPQNAAPLSLTTVQQQQQQQQQVHQTGPSPLFRIESADDDLGLTCQLGQVGPAATCPCATPRYKVVAATTTFPDSLSSPKSEFNSEPHPSHSEEMSKNNNPFGNPSDSSLALPTSSDGKLYFEEKGGKSSWNEHQSQNQSHDHNNNLFWADEETGDVFLHEGFKLQPSKHYFITLQVSALQVNHSGYKPWKDEVVATLYVKPSSSGGEKKTRVSRSKQLYSSLEDSPRSSSSTPNEMKSRKMWKEEELHEKDDFGDLFGPSKYSQVYLKDEDDSSPEYFDSNLANSQSEEMGANEPKFFDDNKKNSFGESRQNSKRSMMMNAGKNSKNKLPYALRGDRPHYKFSDYQGGSSYSEKREDGGRGDEYIPDDSGQPFLHRWKRQSLLPEDFELTLSRLTESITSERLGFGEKIKMQLVIQVPSVDSVDFDVEILNSNEDPRFAILSAHVSSIGSDISFDKDQTNLAPILKPSKNISLYDSAIWHWKSVKRAKTERSRNKGITIEFDIVPVKMAVGSGSYSNVSRRNPLLQLSSLPTSSSLSKPHSSQGTNVSPLGQVTKDFNTYLLPIRARLSFPLPLTEEHPRSRIPHEIGHHHFDKSKFEKISQRLFPVSINSTSKRQIDNGSGSGSQQHRRAHIDKNLNKMMGNRRENGVSIGNGVEVSLEGPREIPQGEWKSYTIKVYLKQPSQFKLTIEQIEGNDILDQDSISVGDIRLVKMGKSIASCSEIPEKGGFRVSCKKSGGRKGDLCSVESPLLNFCPDHLYSNGEGQESGSQKESVTAAEETENEGNVLQFEGIIYGLPGAAPGSQFVLRAHVYARSSTEQSASQMTSTSTTMIFEDERTLAGKIVRRRQENLKHLKSHSNKNGYMNDDHVDGKISIMPKDEDHTGNGGIKSKSRRSRRSLLFPSNQLLTTTTTTTTTTQRFSGGDGSSIVGGSGSSSLVTHNRLSASEKSHHHRRMKSSQKRNEHGSVLTSRLLFHDLSDDTKLTFSQNSKTVPTTNNNNINSFTLGK